MCSGLASTMGNLTHMLGMSLRCCNKQGFSNSRPLVAQSVPTKQDISDRHEVVQRSRLSHQQSGQLIAGACKCLTCSAVSKALLLNWQLVYLYLQAICFGTAQDRLLPSARQPAGLRRQHSSRAAQTSAFSPPTCRASGTMTRTDTLATLLSSLKAN